MSIYRLDKLNARKLELIEIIDRMTRQGGAVNTMLIGQYRKELKVVEGQIENEKTN